VKIPNEKAPYHFCQVIEPSLGLFWGPSTREDSNRRWIFSLLQGGQIRDGQRWLDSMPFETLSIESSVSPNSTHESCLDWLNEQLSRAIARGSCVFSVMVRRVWEPSFPEKPLPYECQMTSVVNKWRKIPSEEVWVERMQSITWLWGDLRVIDEGIGIVESRPGKYILIHHKLDSQSQNWAKMQLNERLIREATQSWSLLCVCYCDHTNRVMGTGYGKLYVDYYKKCVYKTVLPVRSTNNYGEPAAWRMWSWSCY